MVDGVRTFGFYNAGQDCTAACRIYAQQGIYDQLVEKLGAAVASLKMGAPEDAATELGPLSSLAHLERVSAAVEAARALPHIKVVTGGSRADGAGYYFQPTLLAGARQEDAIVQREVFGPVVSVTPFSDEAQALSWANDSQYGWPPRYGRKMSVAPIVLAPGCSTAAPGSIPTLCWSAKCRTVARSCQATARTCRCMALRIIPWSAM